MGWTGPSMRRALDVSIRTWSRPPRLPPGRTRSAGGTYFPVLAHSGRIRPRGEPCALNPKGTAAFEAHALESRHPYFGQERSFGRSAARPSESFIDYNA